MKAFVVFYSPVVLLDSCPGHPGLDSGIAGEIFKVLQKWNDFLLLIEYLVYMYLLV